MLTAYIINLDNDAGRLKQVEEQLLSYRWITPSRIQALAGSGLSDVATNFLAKQPSYIKHKGTMGCFISHTKAWESLLQSEGSMALVLEDDARATDLSPLETFSFPAGVDLIFCNQRCSYPFESAELQPFGGVLSLISESNGGIGTDGYLVSRAGAAKLLKYVERDGFFSHIDLRLAAYSIDLHEAEELKNSQCTTVARLRKVFPAEHRLVTRVFGKPLIFHASGYGSSRLREDRLRR